MKELSIEEKARLYDEAIINGSRLWESDMITREIYEYIFPELRETEDDRIRKEIMDFLRKGIDGSSFEDVKEKYRTWLSWIQKEGEHANFRKKIQIGDKVTRNEDGMLVNLSQLNRVAKKDKKQGEQKPTEWHSEDEQNLNACLGFIPDEFLRRWLMDAVHVKYDKGGDKIEPKFKVGDWIIDNNIKTPFLIISISNEKYDVISIYGSDMAFSFREVERFYHLWTIQDAMDGDVLSFYTEYKGNKMVQIGIIEKYVGKHGGCSNTFKIYVGVNWDNNLQIGEYMGCSDIWPATKEQRDTLFARMKENGYKWNAKELKLEKIEQDIVWSKEDEKMLDDAIGAIGAADYYTYDDKQEIENWVKSLKDRVLPQNK